LYDFTFGNLNLSNFTLKTFNKFNLKENHFGEEYTASGTNKNQTKNDNNSNITGEEQTNSEKLNPLY